MTVSHNVMGLSSGPDLARDFATGSGIKRLGALGECALGRAENGRQLPLDRLARLAPRVLSDSCNMVLVVWTFDIPRKHSQTTGRTPRPRMLHGWVRGRGIVVQRGPGQPDRHGYIKVPEDPRLRGPVLRYCSIELVRSSTS